MVNKLPKAFDPKQIEAKWYSYWETQGLFRADPSKGGTPFSIVIPPPNVTGSLHMGHALNNTLQDICVRYKRMDGFNVLWMPGTDHAGIATQNVVEKQLAQEGLTRHDLGREAFIDRVWKWREVYGGHIIHQLKRLGASCDWSRERFTMDEGLSRAVREVFVRLYADGLIYKGDYIINWCPRCSTALSDLEVEHQEHDSRLYYVRYPLEEGEGFLTVATTRPETMLGDTAVAVNPYDARYTHLVGKRCRLPLVGRLLPIVADPYVQPEFGTGALKITPAHDPNDFEIGIRHGLEKIRVIDDVGRMNQNAGAFAGLDRDLCRQEIVEALSEQGLMEKVEPYQHKVGHCQRCHTVIEPTLSKQWFVKVKPLAQEAIKAVRDGRTRIIPAKWENDYFAWMENIKDWCISRQIWWGHRIPAWYCQDCGGVTVASLDPSACSSCGSQRLEQDSDVLDTWFSSALWPFSTLGWPDSTPELDFYYPTSLLVTGFDILTFWVARMLMMGLRFMGEVPFRHVYIHALVRDIEGRKMSKSLGNVIDPLEVIDQCGADAFRFALAAFAAQGRDIKLSMERVEGYRNFMNKLWNAARFVLMNLDGDAHPEERGAPTESTLAERWIRSRLARTIMEVRDHLDGYRFNEAAGAIYQFLWHEYCDWFLEWIKPTLYGKTSSEQKRRTQEVMVQVLRHVLQLLHPFAPFITEEIWQSLPGACGSIMNSRYPVADPGVLDPEAEREVELVQAVVGGIRNLRAEMGVAPGVQVAVVLIPPADKESSLKETGEVIRTLAKVGELKVDANSPRPSMAVYSIAEEVEIHLLLQGILDIDKEQERLSREKAQVDKELDTLRNKLGNEQFLQKAPGHVIQKARERLLELEGRSHKLADGIRRLQNVSRA
ncbi:MAG: valine--tRNA ligase [Thermodesulfobacteriota bacterium]